MATLHGKTDKSDEPSTRASTTPAEDVTALATAIVALIRTAPYDDMLWPEIDRALMHASHEVKVLIGSYGTLDPPDVPAGFTLGATRHDKDEPERHRRA